MTDWTGIAAVLAPVTTLLGGLGGYLLAGRNEEARDLRAAERERRTGMNALADRLEEERHAFQRDTLLQLQDELQRLVNLAVLILSDDYRAVKDDGRIDELPDGRSDEAREIIFSLTRLEERVIDHELRAAISAFGDLCVLLPSDFPPGQVPDESRDRTISRLKCRMNEVSDEYGRLTAQLGVQLRHELDRRYLAAPAGPARQPTGRPE